MNDKPDAAEMDRIMRAMGLDPIALDLSEASRTYRNAEVAMSASLANISPLLESCLREAISSLLPGHQFEVEIRRPEPEERPTMFFFCLRMGGISATRVVSTGTILRGDELWPFEANSLIRSWNYENEALGLPSQN